MEYGINIIKNGQIIRTSKNLRGLLEYARISPVVRIESTPLGPNNSTGTFRVFFADGAESRALFRSYHIMIDWLRNRRSWRSAKHIMQGPDIGYLTKPGVIAGDKK